MLGAMLPRRASVAFPRDLSRATTTVRAPFLASVSAATLPIPEVAPVMTTVLPFMDHTSCADQRAHANHTHFNGSRPMRYRRSGSLDGPRPRQGPRAAGAPETRFGSLAIGDDVEVAARHVGVIRLDRRVPLVVVPLPPCNMQSAVRVTDLRAPGQKGTLSPPLQAYLM